MLTDAIWVIAALLIGLFIGYSWGHSGFLRKIAYEEADRWSRMTTRRILGEHIPTFSEVIGKISPSFCSIYEQAAAAESGKLHLVAGVAYGKALEFVVKDYAKYERPEKATDIDRSLLGVCIKNYISDPSLRESAQLAAWLRNDETHYVRRFKDKDVEDLKGIIALTIRLIEHAEERKGLEADVAKFGSGMRPT
jgi:hypothetical protein